MAITYPLDATKWPPIPRNINLDTVNNPTETQLQPAPSNWCVNQKATCKGKSSTTILAIRRICARTIQKPINGSVMISLKPLADLMLGECGVTKIVGLYGEVGLHGAYSLDLMTWPEIDVWILNDNYKSVMTWQMIANLARVVPPTHVHVVNQLDRSLGMTPPDSVTIDYRFLWQDVEWKLDICVGSHERHAGGLAYLDQVKQQLTPEKRDAILAIKQLATASPAYRKSRWQYMSGRSQFKSIDIYRAVLVDGVRTPLEFADYLWRHARIDVSQDFGLQPGTFSIVASP